MVIKMNRNAIHMLRSVTDTIGDSLLITTKDGKLIVIDGGYATETDYFVDYLKKLTGQDKPRIDVWFLTHPHKDHCGVFFEIVGDPERRVDFEEIYANFPADPSFYDGVDEEGVAVVAEYRRLYPLFADRAAELSEGEILQIGAAKFTVLYTFNPAWKRVNDASTVMRMDLGGVSVMFTGDAGLNAGNYVVGRYGGSRLMRCDICKMAHHGQDGVDRNFYEAVAPGICLWSTPSWVYGNINGNLKTFETREWIKELKVGREYKSFEGTQMIPLGE